LGGTAFPEGVIFVNEDTGTQNGEIWMVRPDGSDLLKIADTTGLIGATETTGILDISTLLGYYPGSVVLTNNQGSNSSMTLLINPDITLIDADGDGVGDDIDNCTLVSNPDQNDADGDGFGNLCDPDTDNNCVVNFLDLANFSNAFLSNDPVNDFNGDGVVNFIDFPILVDAFTSTPGPSGVGSCAVPNRFALNK